MQTNLKPDINLQPWKLKIMKWIPITRLQVLPKKQKNKITSWWHQTKYINFCNSIQKRHKLWRIHVCPQAPTHRKREHTPPRKCIKVKAGRKRQTLHNSATPRYPKQQKIQNKHWIQLQNDEKLKISYAWVALNFTMKKMVVCSCSSINYSEKMKQTHLGILMMMSDDGNCSALCVVLD